VSLFGIPFSTLLRLRGLGLLRPDDTAHGAARLPADRDIDQLGLAGATGTSHSLESSAGPPLDQLGIQSCAAHAVLGGEVTCMAARYGITVPLGSRLMGYYGSRVYHQKPVRDGGTYLRTEVKFLARFGITAEAAWPYRTMRVNDQPPLSAFLGAYKRRGIRGYYFLFDSGDALLDAYMAALEDNRPVAFGVGVDKAFTEDIGPDRIEYSRGPLIGGHALQILGYERVGSRTWFRCKNSWGAGWRDGGYAWLAEDWLLNGWQHVVVDPAA
jgi:hypothetical protein